MRKYGVAIVLSFIVSLLISLTVRPQFAIGGECLLFLPVCYAVNLFGRKANITDGELEDERDC